MMLSNGFQNAGKVNFRNPHAPLLLLRARYVALCRTALFSLDPYIVSQDLSKVGLWCIDIELILMITTVVITDFLFWYHTRPGYFL